LHLRAAFAAAREFYQILLAIDAAGRLPPDARQRRCVAHTAPLHLPYQLLVSHRHVVNLNKAAVEKSGDRLSPAQRPSQHMQLNVLAQQVLVAHQARIHHPHAHDFSIKAEPRAPDTAEMISVSIIPSRCLPANFISFHSADSANSA
jgi:hypothetical protein